MQKTQIKRIIDLFYLNNVKYLGNANSNIEYYINFISLLKLILNGIYKFKIIALCDRYCSIQCINKSNRKQPFS